MNALYLIGFVQSLFFIVLIASKKKVELKDHILSAYLLILGFNLIFIYWNQTGFHDKNPFIIILDLAYWTLLGPLLYLYVDLTISKNSKLSTKHLIHLFPLVFVLISFSEYFYSGMKESFFAYQNDSVLFKLGYFVWMYNSPVYYIVLIFKLRRHKKTIKGYYSSQQDVDLKWLNYLVHGFAVFLVFLLSSPYIYMALGIELTISSYHYTWLIMVVYIFGIGYFGHKQRGIFTEEEFKNEHAESESMPVVNGQQNGKPQYLKTGLTDEEAEQIQQSLETYMNNEKPYLDYDLTLPKLAGMIDTTSHKLSQVINERYQLNFFEYVNKHRVNDVKKLLKSPSKADEKIMALAYDCGFNSKSAFYNFFKKETSLTPSEYRNKYLSLIEA